MTNADISKVCIRLRSSETLDGSESRCDEILNVAWKSACEYRAYLHGGYSAS